MWVKTGRGVDAVGGQLKEGGSARSGGVAFTGEVWPEYMGLMDLDKLWRIPLLRLS